MEVPTEGRARPTGAVSTRRRRKKTRSVNEANEASARALRERERELQKLHVEATGLQREGDDASQGSDSERRTPPRSLARADLVIAAPKDLAAERRCIIDKLNRRMKP